MMLTDTLKSETQTLHDAIEKNHFMQKLEAKTFTLEDYKALLTLFYGLHYMAEKQLDAFEELDMPHRERCSHLREDLLSLGSTEGMLKKSYDTDLELNIDTLSKAYGALYVLEGSRMGGMFLTKMLRSHLGEDIPVSYFEGVKEKTPAYVGAFKTSINERERELHSKECIQCAKDVFTFIAYLFARSA